MPGERMSWKLLLSVGRGAPAGSHTLQVDDTLRLPRGAGEVKVETGVVVITRQGDPIDHVLRAGDSLDLASSGRPVAWALESSRITIGARDPAPRSFLFDGRPHFASK